MNRAVALSIVSALALLGAAGCVQRKITVTSDPPGATVMLNNRDVGRTPLTTDFLWYGDYDVVVRRDGYETINSKKKIAAPWWQFPPFDFFAEISPTEPVDQHHLNFVMTPRRDDDTADQLVARGRELQARMPTTQATSRPTTAPAVAAATR